MTRNKERAKQLSLIEHSGYACCSKLFHMHSMFDENFHTKKQVHLIDISLNDIECVCFLTGRKGDVSSRYFEFFDKQLHEENLRMRHAHEQIDLLIRSFVVIPNRQLSLTCTSPW